MAISLPFESSQGMYGTGLDVVLGPGVVEGGKVVGPVTGGLVEHPYASQNLFSQSSGVSLLSMSHLIT